jgi:hypothetical protein
MVGLIFDLCAYLFKYKLKGIYVGIFAVAPIEIILIFVLYTALKLPGTEMFFKYWWGIALLFIMLTCIGVFLGTKIFNRIKNKRAIKLIMNN